MEECNCWGKTHSRKRLSFESAAGAKEGEEETAFVEMHPGRLGPLQATCNCLLICLIDVKIECIRSIRSCSKLGMFL